jgi:hypothetical protein
MKPEGAVVHHLGGIVEELRLSYCGHSMVCETAAAGRQLVLRQSHTMQ